MELFGSSGIRRVVDREFLQLTFEVGLAVGGSYHSVIVGCDTRTSSDAMRFAFLAGLLATGAEAAHAGLVPTPTLAYASRHFEAGAMLTASHNPPQYNGIKLVNPDGSAFNAVQREQIEKSVTDSAQGAAHWEKITKCTDYADAVEEHIERIVRELGTGLQLKVAIDCGCGAASRATPGLLARLGCKVVPVNCEPGGHFPRGLEPVPENLQDLIRAVKSEGAALGIAHDGDGDRVAVIDENGQFIESDKLIALLARQLGARKVVTTVDASMLIEELGFEVVRTRVGDAFVSDELGSYTGEGYRDAFGAEPSGCFIFPSISLCPDGIYAAAIVAHIASEHNLSSIIEQIPSYPVLRGSIDGDKSAMVGIEKKLRKEVESGGRLETVDGLRLDFGDGWLLIRASGTEPKIRITAEARNEQRARQIYDLGFGTINECLIEQERTAR